MASNRRSNTDGEREPSPKNSLQLVTLKGLTTLEPIEITNFNVGWKAFGLSTLPKEWVPNFFVISGECFCTNVGSEGEDSIVQSIDKALSSLGLSHTASVFIRSSGEAETLDDRGQLESLECNVKNIWSSAKDLIERVSNAVSAGSPAVHLVVQRAIPLAGKGHLANERRLSYEPRDWVAEFEPIGGDPGHTEPVAVRTWRSGKAVDTSRLSCQARTAIGIALKRVGNWAMQFNPRMHFEWVWDGSTVWLVQADKATSSPGVDPRSLIPKRIPKLDIEQLRVFRKVSDEDYATYTKLGNAKLYSELGYRMPMFFVLDRGDLISDLLRGIVGEDLSADLRILTKRPFIIRTDGADIPKSKREMLPRSDELRSLEDACAWLIGPFANAINKAELAGAGLCLIAHHFIPSVASAWARAEPANPIVRIESLWGIPEGLYWHSHDTFEVDTGSRTVEPGVLGDELHYDLRDRPRYKGTFIAGDEAGRWVPQATDAAHDWARSITKKQWIFEIARTTRLIAERRQEAVSVMWFVDNHSDATPHKVLPWFHSPSSLEGPKAAPRRKHFSAHEVVIRHVADWEKLRGDVAQGKPIERVVMAPIDTELIRNPAFASELARLAKDVGFVVELSGGILSHAYYMLSREGCRVECVDLFGAGEEVLEFHKLVRDKIPAMIRDRGERVESIALTGDALVRALRQKLVEEAFEALDAASGDELLGELADVQEVLLALASALNVDNGTLEQERLRKRKKRGGFDEGLMLIKTAAPQSVGRSSQETQAADDLGMVDEQERPVPSVSNPLILPPKAPYRRPDLRSVGGAMEKLFTFRTDIESLQRFQQRLAFDMPVPQAGKNLFVLAIELDRVKAQVRGKIRLQVGPSQLELPL